MSILTAFIGFISVQHLLYSLLFIRAPYWLISMGFPPGAPLTLFIVSGYWRTRRFYVNSFFVLFWRVATDKPACHTQGYSPYYVSSVSVYNGITHAITYSHLTQRHSNHIHKHLIRLFEVHCLLIHQYFFSDTSSLRLFNVSAHSILIFISKIDSVSYVTNLFQ